MSQPKVSNQSQAAGSDTEADPEVVVRAQRRQFSVVEKVRILAEADTCQGAGEIGALLRREGIYSSYLTQWRRERTAGQFGEKAAPKRGRPRQEKASEAARLRQENEQLKAQLAQAELIITAQKKLAQALENVLTVKPGMPS
jgi:transposase-like protein